MVMWTFEQNVSKLAHL